MTWLNMGEMLRVNAVKFGDKEALKDERKSLTFREFNDRATRLANAMMDLGLRKGDRICTPTRGLPAGVKAKELTHGVQTDKAGRPRAYCICKRSPLGGFAFERIVRAAFMEHHGFFDRFDQLRGISPLAPAVNTLRDCYEGYDYALAKMKVAQLFALAFYRQQVDFEGEVYERETVISGSEDAAEGSLEAEDQQRYKVDFGRGPIKLELDEGDRAEFLEVLDGAVSKTRLKLTASVRKAIFNALSERDESAAVCVDRHGHPEPDPALRDYERVPLEEDVQRYFEREVLPHVPDAWINIGVRDQKDQEVGRVGYEINFNRYFYQYAPPRPLEEIEADIRGLESDIMEMLKEVTG